MSASEYKGRKVEILKREPWLPYLPCYRVFIDEKAAGSWHWNEWSAIRKAKQLIDAEGGRKMSDQFNDEAKEQTICEIARRHLRIGTLEIRNRDGLDFHDCSVESIRAALEAAYTAGFSAAKEGK